MLTAEQQHADRLTNRALLAVGKSLACCVRHVKLDGGRVSCVAMGKEQPARVHVHVLPHVALCTALWGGRKGAGVALKIGAVISLLFYLIDRGCST